MSMIDFFLPVIIMFVIVGLGVTLVFVGKSMMDGRRTALDGTKTGSTWLHIVLMAAGGVCILGVAAYLLIPYIFNS